MIIPFSKTVTFPSFVASKPTSDAPYHVMPCTYGIVLYCTYGLLTSTTSFRSFHAAFILYFNSSSDACVMSYKISIGPHFTTVKNKTFFDLMIVCLHIRKKRCINMIQRKKERLRLMLHTKSILVSIAHLGQIKRKRKKIKRMDRQVAALLTKMNI